MLSRTGTASLNASLAAFWSLVAIAAGVFLRTYEPVTSGWRYDCDGHPLVCTLPCLGTVCQWSCSLTLHRESVDITEKSRRGHYRHWGLRSRKVKKRDNRKNDSVRCHCRRLDAGLPCTGLLRDIVLANTVGASAGADAFFVAFKIPNFLRRSLLVRVLLLRHLFRCLPRHVKRKVNSPSSG